jgi:hypothetical protein
MRRQRWRTAAAATASTLVAVGCGALLGIDGPDGVPFPLVDAGNDPAETASETSTDAGPAGPDECAHLTVPRPNGDDEPDAANNKLGRWIALRTVSLAPGGTAPGYDLDETCTCFQGNTARKGAASCKGRGVVDACDQAGGVDNAVWSLLQRNKLPDTDLNELYPYTKRASQGLAAILVHIYEYNGKANDAEVSVGFVRAFGIQTDQGCDGRARGLNRDPVARVEYNPAVDAGNDARVDSTQAGDGGTRRFVNGFAPVWDGCDKWMLTEGDYFAQDPNNFNGLIPLRQFKGYISNYQLVVQDDGPFPLGNRLVTVAQLTMVAKLNPRIDDAGGLQNIDIDNFTVAGRIQLDDAIILLGTFEAVGQQYCALTDLFNRSAVDLCNSLDVAKNRSFDNRDGVCEAISFGITATGVSTWPELPTSSRRFLPRPEANCDRIPVTDEQCRLVDAGAK